MPMPKMMFILKNGDENIYPGLIKMLAVDWSMTSAYKTHALCSYLRSVTGSLYIAMYVKLTSSQSTLHATQRREDKILEEKIKYRKHNNAANYIERFNIPTVLMAMFTVCVTFFYLPYHH
jgi:hypothetical protein